MEADLSRVMIAEDELMIRLSLKEELERVGHEVVVAADAKGAELTLTRSGRKLDIVVLDNDLGSGPSGFEIARSLRDRDALIPIILMTADRAGTFVAASLGNAAHLMKPFHEGALAALVDKVLGGSPATAVVRGR